MAAKRKGLLFFPPLLCTLLGPPAQMLSGTESTRTLNQIRKTAYKIPPILLNFPVAVVESMNLVLQIQRHFPSTQVLAARYTDTEPLTSS